MSREHFGKIRSILLLKVGTQARIEIFVSRICVLA